MRLFVASNDFEASLESLNTLAVMFAQIGKRLPRVSTLSCGDPCVT